MSDNTRTETLRVAVLVESLTVPEWVEWTVGQIDALRDIELTAVVTAPGVCGMPARNRIYRLYQWVDTRVFGPATAMRDADLSSISLGRTVAGSDPPDVVVSFIPADRTAWDGPPPTHGVWAIAPMDDGRPASAPARFWELRGRSDTASTAVVAVDDGFQRVIAQTVAAADPLSLARTRNLAAWASAHLVLRALRSLQRDGGRVPGGEQLSEPRGLPAPAVTVRQAARTLLRGVAARSRTMWCRDEWFVAVRERSADGGIQAPLLVLPNPEGRYLADPFPIEVGGRHFLFVEDYSRAAGHAVISVSEAGADGAWSPPRKVLERDHHLSYPFVFEHEGAIYMLPETGEAGRVELHRAVEFPDHWQLDRVLLDGLNAVDATLHIEDGVFWLFANIIEGHGDRGELWLFSATSLAGEWRPHPRNPIVSDPGTARPAGRLFRRGDSLIRPGQDCSRGYGEAVVLNRVDVLSLDEYRETPVDRIEPDWLPGLDGTHTYTFDSRYECLDGYRYVPRLRIGRPMRRAKPEPAVGNESVRRLSPSVRAGMPFSERMRENAELLRSYRRSSDGRSDFEWILNDLAQCDELLRRHTGRPLSDARVFEIGYGARPYRLRAIHATGADVYGVDAEAALLADRPSEYLTILRRNGWERFAKTFIRHALFDRRQQAMFSEMLAQRGLHAPAPEPHRFLVGDAADCRPPGPFDLICSFAVFEHIERDSLERLVARMPSWLVPDGIALIVPDVFTGFHGGHLVEWEANTLDLEIERRSEPWEHLRKRRYRANTTLNELTRDDYLELFSEHFEILEIIDGPRGRQAEFLTPEIRAELPDYTDDDLLDENPLFVLRPR